MSQFWILKDISTNEVYTRAIKNASSSHGTTSAYRFPTEEELCATMRCGIPVQIPDNNTFRYPSPNCYAFEVSKDLSYCAPVRYPDLGNPITTKNIESLTSHAREILNAYNRISLAKKDRKSVISISRSLGVDLSDDEINQVLLDVEEAPDHTVLLEKLIESSINDITKPKRWCCEHPEIIFTEIAEHSVKIRPLSGDPFGYNWVISAPDNGENTFRSLECLNCGKSTSDISDIYIDIHWNPFKEEE